MRPGFIGSFPPDRRAPPPVVLLEEFEFSGSWEGTVANTVPAPNFAAPSASFLEEFDSGWDGV